MYSVRILRGGLKEIAALPAGYTKLVGERIDRLGEEPRPPGAKKLKGSCDYSLRVGVYRIIYDVSDETRVVTVYRVKHRREAYR